VSGFVVELLSDLQRNKDAGLSRSLSTIGPAASAHVSRHGRTMLNLASNNYLGLAQHGDVVRGACDAARRWGAGATGSALITGHTELHEELARAIASLKRTERALLFPSGYQACVGAVVGLCGKGDLILSDSLNHASLIDGCRLSRADVRVYRHGDVDQAKRLLADRAKYRRCMIVTDGVFSMDGDLAPLVELRALCADCDCRLVVDDAHGTGVLGDRGSGISEFLGIAGRVDVQIGTLSKAIGSQGGFVAGSKPLIDVLTESARSMMFSTALAPPAVGAALAALKIIEAEPARRSHLAALAAAIRSGLSSLGLEIRDDPTAIVPVIIGDPCRAMRISEVLAKSGVWAPAIRPPSVPDGLSRIRLSVTAEMTLDDIDVAVNAIGSAFALEHDKG